MMTLKRFTQFKNQEIRVLIAKKGLYQWFRFSNKLIQATNLFIGPLHMNKAQSKD